MSRFLYRPATAGRFLLLAAMLAALSLLVACSDDEAGAEATVTASPTTSTASATVATEATSSAPAEGGSVVVQHGLGELTLDAPAQRVIALEWSYAEDLVAVGVQPVGVADISGYESWVAAAPLDASVADVGLRQEPNLEAIADLDPDLIIAVDFRHEAIYDQLNAIAPTLMFNAYPEDLPDQHDQMEDNFRQVAIATGREAEADEVLANLEAHYAEAAAKIEAAGVAGEPFVLMQGWSQDQTPMMRLFTDNAMAVQIIERLGLDNAITAEPQLYGYVDADIEGVLPYADANFIYIVQDDDNIVDEYFQSNAIWQGMNFVQEERYYSLGGDAWTFGGPLSAQLIADRVVALLAE